MFPNPPRPLTEKEARNIQLDITYCLESDKQFIEDLSTFESRRMRWAEPETLIQVRPKIMSLLKSRKFKPDSNDDPRNLMSNYQYVEGENEQEIEEKITAIREQCATEEYDTLVRCVHDSKNSDNVTNNSDKECSMELQYFGLLVGSVLCKNDILKCLERTSSLHQTKLEEVSSIDFANCVSTSKCFETIGREGKL